MFSTLGEYLSDEKCNRNISKISTIIQASVIDDFAASKRKNQKGILHGISTLLGRLVATLDEDVMALVHTITVFPAGSVDYANLFTAVEAAGGFINMVFLGLRLLFGIIPSVIIITGTSVLWMVFPSNSR